MSDVGGRVWLAYNGEIYNFREICQELKSLGYEFASRSDTEVLLYAYLEWGEECVDRLNGMFAFAIWDSRRNRLFLARDRYGIKPLYYLEHDGALLFASEIKSILQYPGVVVDVDLLALNEYFSFQNTFSGRTLFEGVRLLPPGHVMTVDLHGGVTRQRPYWDFDFSRECSDSPKQVQQRLAELIRQAVRRQCVSDVPVGCYLSGGMDSGTVTALTAEKLGRICTFTAGFDLSEAAQHELAFDEREPAERMANLFQTEHYECVLHSGDMEACMNQLVWHLEDLRVGQCYPNWYVARLAGRFVKVVLAGTGGDELFGGYPWRYAAAVGSDYDDFVRNYYRYWKRLVSNRDKPRLFHPDVVARLISLRDGDAVPFRDHTLSVFRRILGENPRGDDPVDQVRNSLYFECKTFLHGLLLVEDKLSMAHSLESRVPFLDNDLVDFACRVPVTLKVAGVDRLKRLDENLPRKRRLYEQNNGGGKAILRRTMQRMLPREITGARKQGFSAPDESWFRGRAERYVRDVLLDPGANTGQLINREYVRRKLDDHCSGRVNHRLLIWSLLSLEYWCERFLTGGRIRHARRAA